MEQMLREAKKLLKIYFLNLSLARVRPNKTRGTLHDKCGLQSCGAATVEHYIESFYLFLFGF